MSTLLAIESSQQLCSVALQYQGKIYQRETAGQRSHTEFLLPFIDELLGEQQLTIQDLDAISYSAGPGSFTGIRLAASISKSLAYAANLPVITISSLAAMAQSYAHETSECTVITDARMGECYLGTYQKNAEGLMLPQQDDQLLKLEALADKDFNNSLILTDNMTVIGNALNTSNTLIECQASATAQLALAQTAYKQQQTQNAIDSQPVYLRGKSGWKTVSEQQQ